MKEDQHNEKAMATESVCQVAGHPHVCSSRDSRQRSGKALQWDTWKAPGVPSLEAVGLESWRSVDVTGPRSSKTGIAEGGPQRPA